MSLKTDYKAEQHPLSGEADTGRPRPQVVRGPEEGLRLFTSPPLVHHVPCSSGSRGLTARWASVIEGVRDLVRAQGPDENAGL